MSGPANSGAKYAQVDFDQINQKGLKDLLAAINKTGATVLEVDSSNRATMKDGVKVKSAKIILQDGQTLGLQVNDTGDISAIKLNGKAIPNGQSASVQALGAVMGNAAQRNTAKFTASLAAKAARVANPVDKKPALKSNFQKLQEAKERNARVSANYLAITRAVTTGQQAITDLKAQLEKESGRLTNAQALNQQLKQRIKQLKAGS